MVSSRLRKQQRTNKLTGYLFVGFGFISICITQSSLDRPLMTAALGALAFVILRPLNRKREFGSTVHGVLVTAKALLIQGILAVANNEIGNSEPVGADLTQLFGRCITRSRPSIGKAHAIVKFLNHFGTSLVATAHKSSPFIEDVLFFRNAAQVHSWATFECVDTAGSLGRGRRRSRRRACRGRCRGRRTRRRGRSCRRACRGGCRRCGTRRRRRSSGGCCAR